jgi:hypothetical protein
MSFYEYIFIVYKLTTLARLFQSNTFIKDIDISLCKFHDGWHIPELRPFGISSKRGVNVDILENGLKETCPIYNS